MPQDDPAAKILVVTAMQREAAALSTLDAVACGTRTASALALRALLVQHEPELVIIAGVCGGLDPSLRPGDVILARKVYAADSRELAPDPSLLGDARRAFRDGRQPFISSCLLTVDRPLTPLAARTDAWNRTGAAGVDMETYHLARAAATSGVSWLAVRVVLDPTSDELPRSLYGWSGETDRSVALRALPRPMEWAAYLRLALQWRRAAASLRSAVPTITDAAAEALRQQRETTTSVELPFEEDSAVRD